MLLRESFPCKIIFFLNLAETNDKKYKLGEHIYHVLKLPMECVFRLLAGGEVCPVFLHQRAS